MKYFFLTCVHSMPCSLDKMEEQEMFYENGLISMKDRLDRFFLNFGCRLRKLTLVRVERTSCGSEILWL